MLTLSLTSDKLIRKIKFDNIEYVKNVHIIGNYFFIIVGTSALNMYNS